MTLAAQPPDDGELLRRYAAQQAEDAFAELVRRHLRLVHTAARRQAGGEDAAADVTQAVFTELARRAPSLTRHPALVGWLYTTTRRLAQRQVRDAARRRRREASAAAQAALLVGETDDAPDWERLRPVIDDAMHELAEIDRRAVLLRCFEGLPLSRVGARLGLSEDAARMRVSRALERLRRQLAQRGITSSATSLAGALAGETVARIPAAMISSVTSQAILGSPATTATALGFFAFMASIHSKITIAVVALAMGGAAVVWERQKVGQLQQENARLEQRLARMIGEARDAGKRVEELGREAARLRAEPSELLRLRGEVAQLRREAARAATGKAAGAAAPVAAAAPPPPAGPAALAEMHASIPAGHSLLTGGWVTPSGQRAVLLLTPEVQDSGGGGGSVLIRSMLFEGSEAVLKANGYGSLLAADGDPAPQTLLEPAKAKEMVEALQGIRGMTLTGPSVLSPSGAQAEIGLTDAATAMATTFDLLPVIGADGKVELTLKVASMPAPPRDAQPGEEPAPSKP